MLWPPNAGSPMRRANGLRLTTWKQVSLSPRKRTSSSSVRMRTPRKPSENAAVAAGFPRGLCEGMKSKPIGRTYHRAAVVDAGRVHRYLVECQEHSLPRCEPLTAGEKLRGYFGVCT